LTGFAKGSAESASAIFSRAPGSACSPCWLWATTKSATRAARLAGSRVFGENFIARDVLDFKSFGNPEIQMCLLALD
jgi:hypothetical protein